MFSFDFRSVNRLTPRFEIDGMGGGSSEPSVSAPATDPGQSNSTDPVSIPAAMPTWGMPKDPNNQAPALVNPLLSVQPPLPGVPAVEVVPPVPGLEVLDWGGRKVEVKDPIIKDLHKDYTSLQAKATQDSQQLSTMKAQLEQANQTLQKFLEFNGGATPQAQSAPQSQEPPARTAEDMEAAKAAFFDEFYENPEGALEKFAKDIIEKTVNPVLGPIKQERELAAQNNEWNQAVQTAAGKHADFGDFVPHMDAVLQNMPGVKDLGIDAVYFLAKGMAGAVAQPAPTPEQMAADPAFLQSHIYGNEEIRNHFVNQYVSGVHNRQNQTPPVIGVQPGGTPPALPENRPQTIAEAGKALRRNWGLR